MSGKSKDSAISLDRPYLMISYQFSKDWPWDHEILDYRVLNLPDPSGPSSKTGVTEPLILMPKKYHPSIYEIVKSRYDHWKASQELKGSEELGQSKSLLTPLDVAMGLHGVYRRNRIGDIESSSPWTFATATQARRRATLGEESAGLSPHEVGARIIASIGGDGKAFFMTSCNPDGTSTRLKMYHRLEPLEDDDLDYWRFLATARGANSLQDFKEYLERTGQLSTEEI